ncbi:MAG: CotH kinase family protein, partial [Planctomycetota bacterium]
MDSTQDRTFRLLIRGEHLDILRADVLANDQQPATVIALGRTYHDVRVRFRGNGSRTEEPKSWQLRFSDDNPFPDGNRVFLNGFQPERQVMGMDLWRRIGMPYSRARNVHVVLNGLRYPHYAQVEPIDDAFLERHFGPNGPEGELYRGLRIADFSYLGDDPKLYAPHYELRTDGPADLSDLIELCRVFAETDDEDFPNEIARHINVGEWIRWIAANEVLSNQEGGLHRDTGDDYFVYRPRGGRYLLLPWDMDSVYLEPEQEIFRPAIPAIRRLITHPDLAPIFYEELRNIVNEHFGEDDIARQLKLLEGSYSSQVLDEFVTFARQRRAFVEASVSQNLSAEISEGGFGHGSQLFATNDTVTLTGLAPAGTARRVVVSSGSHETADLDVVHSRWSLRYRVRSPEAILRVRALGHDDTVVAERRVLLRRVDRVTRWSSETFAGERRLTKADSPYVFSGVNVVPESSSLTIEDGARVYLTDAASFEVSGVLRIAGLADQPTRIEISGNRASPWLNLKSGSRAELEYVDVSTGAPPSNERPDFPLIEAKASELRIVSCEFVDLPGVVVEVLDNSILTVVSSHFENTGEAIHGIASTVVAIGNTIHCVRGNGDGIDLDLDAGGSRL